MTPVTFQRRLLHALRSARMWPPGARVVVAVSGGADSMAMLEALRRLSVRRDAGWELHVAHLEHGLRGRAGRRDAAFVRSQAAARGCLFHVKQTLAAARAKKDRTGLEETARRLRYEFLQQVASQVGAGYVALGHHADDQAETILHHLLRGTGWRGLAGMPAVRPLTTPGGSDLVRIARPLLGFRRAELHAYLVQCGVPYCTDATNTDVRHTRNRIRHRLLPLLEGEFNPRIVDALLRLAAQARQAAESVERQASEVLARARWDDTDEPRGKQSSAGERGMECGVPFDLWRAAECNVRGEIVRRALERLGAPLRGVSFERLSAVAMGLANGQGGRVFEMPAGARVTRRGRELVIRAPIRARHSS